MIAIYAVHPIMYQVPIFRSINQLAIADRVDVCVFFGSDVSLRNIFFEETQTIFRPDTPSMLDGYKYIFPFNLGTRQPGGFFSRINLGFLINISLKRYSVDFGFLLLTKGLKYVYFDRSIVGRLRLCQ